MLYDGDAKTTHEHDEHSRSSIPRIEYYSHSWRATRPQRERDSAAAAICKWMTGQMDENDSTV